MEAFQNCDFRSDNVCFKSKKPCYPNSQISASRCWRMKKDHVSFLQCPECENVLWTEKFINNPKRKRDFFFCSACNKEVKKTDAIQTEQLLQERINKLKKQLIEKDEPGAISEITLKILALQNTSKIPIKDPFIKKFIEFCQAEER